MAWLDTLAQLGRDRTPLVMATVIEVRGHAPRGAGSKMLVTATEIHGSVGGGDLEQRAINEAREALLTAATEPRLLTLTLNPEGGKHGLQCCGGEVTLLLEPIHTRRITVAIFGTGHVGWALTRVLSTLPISLTLIDSRSSMLDQESLPGKREAEIELRHAPVPESAVETLPTGSHLLVLTHDHAEDLAILDMALRRDDLGFLGLIGSSTKWSHFRRRLADAGHSKESLRRVTTPIGLPGVPGKSPAAIAIATAAQLLTVLELPEGGF